MSCDIVWWIFSKCKPFLLQCVNCGFWFLLIYAREPLPHTVWRLTIYDMYYGLLSHCCHNYFLRVTVEFLIPFINVSFSCSFCGRFYFTCYSHLWTRFCTINNIPWSIRFQNYFYLKFPYSPVFKIFQFCNSCKFTLHVWLHRYFHLH